jgi:hypothetical protein
VQVDDGGRKLNAVIIGSVNVNTGTYLVGPAMPRTGSRTWLK